MTYVTSSLFAFGHFGTIWRPGAHAVNTYPGIYTGIMIALAPLGALATTFRTTIFAVIPHAGALVQTHYSVHNGLVSPPAEAFVSHGSYYAIQPQWTQFVVPFTLLLACLSLYACDALAERLGVSRRRRMFLAFVEGVLLWNVSVLAGHPEDAIALALAIYAFVFAIDGRFVGAGWLIGAAVCFQPLVLLMIPVLLVMAGWPAAFGMALRAAAPTIVLLAGPLIGAFHSTFQELTKQPNYPFLDHQTPWTAVGGHVSGQGRTYAVAGGPGHLISVLLACGVGAWVRRWRTRPELLAWSCALVLALGPYTDTVMNPYYVWPALALGVVVAAKAPTLRFILASAFAILTSVAGHMHLAWLPWWLLVVGGMTIVLVAAAWPGPVDAEVAIETSRFRVWLAEFFEMRPPAILAASSGPNTPANTKTPAPQPRASVPASSRPNTPAATKTPHPQPRAKVPASSGPNTPAARKTPHPQPRVPVTASSRSNMSAVRKKRKGR